MKLTPETLSSKLGKKVDINTIEELELGSMGFSDAASFSRLKNLKKLDLKSNRFQLIRHIKGFFDLPVIEEINFTGNPVTKQSNYRITVLHSLPTLQILDEITVTQQERDQARSFDPNNVPKGSDPLSRLASQDSDEDDDLIVPVVINNNKPVEQPKPVPVQQSKPVIFEEKPQKPVVVEEKPKPVTVQPQKPVEQAKPVPQAKPVVIKEEDIKEPEPVRPQPKPQPAVKKPITNANVLDEDSLFGKSKEKKIVFEDDEEISLDSINISDLEKKKQPVKKESKLTFIDDEDDDDIFKSSKLPAKKSTTSASNAAIDDDLFGDDSNSKKSISSDFDINSYIQSQKNRSKGGLFD